MTANPEIFQAGLVFQEIKGPLAVLSNIMSLVYQFGMKGYPLKQTAINRYEKIRLYAKYQEEKEQQVENKQHLASLGGKRHPYLLLGVNSRPPAQRVDLCLSLVLSSALSVAEKDSCNSFHKKRLVRALVTIGKGGMSMRSKMLRLQIVFFVSLKPV